MWHNALIHFGSRFEVRSSNCWIRSSGEEDAEEEVRSQEVEEEKFKSFVGYDVPS